MHSVAPAKKQQRRRMKTEVNAAKAALQSATTTLDSVPLQYDEQLEELQDDKTALRVMFEDDKVVAAGLRHDLKRTEATIAQLNTRLTTSNSSLKTPARSIPTTSSSVLSQDTTQLFQESTYKDPISYLKDLLQDGE
jgi:peptidoglycan hydrolase CwlO-like protein